MEIVAAAGNTALNILAVVPEIKGKDRLCMSPLVHLFIHSCPLLRAYHKIGNGARAGWHICKEPRKFNALINQPIHVFI